MLRRTPIALLLLGLALSTSPASAKSKPAASDSSASGAVVGYINRPLVLPPLTFRPTFDVDITHTSITTTVNGTSASASGNGAAVAFGLDVGIIAGLQAGIFLAFPVAGISDFGTFAANLQWSAASTVNLRLDLGAQRQQSSFSFPGGGGGAAPDSYLLSPKQDNFLFGLGAPIRVKVTPIVAIVSGSPEARGFDSQPVLSASYDIPFLGTSRFAAYGSLFTADIFTLSTGTTTATVAGQSITTRTTAGALHLPLGVIVQPWRFLGFGARLGYRYVFVHGSNDRDSTTTNHAAHYIPLGFDLIASPIRWLDIGFSATIYGEVANDARSSSDTANHYGDASKFDLWVGGRF